MQILSDINNTIFVAPEVCVIVEETLRILLELFANFFI
jgi:hypothetical protein